MPGATGRHLMQKACRPAHVHTVWSEDPAEMPDTATHAVPCVLALFLEMVHLSSYDSPDTPETDDSIEVKTLHSSPEA